MTERNVSFNVYKAVLQDNEALREEIKKLKEQLAQFVSNANEQCAKIISDMEPVG